MLNWAAADSETMTLIWPPWLTLVADAYPSIWWFVAFIGVPSGLLEICQAVVPAFWFSRTIGLGGFGTGVTAALAGEAGPVPIALTAATVNVYAVPFVSPETV